LIDDCLSTLSDATHLSIIDLAEAFHHIPLSEASKPLSAFVTKDGLFQWNVMTFGHTSAPGTFQRYVNRVLRGLSGKICVGYFDDIVIYTSSDVKAHAEAVRIILKRLRDHNLTAKLTKCHFGYTELKFLGHIVANGTVLPDPAKIAAVREFPEPTTVTAVKSFLGLANYYRKFIPGFAIIAKPLYQLTRRDAEFVFDSTCDVSRGSDN
jgi:hypothetical protein